MHICENLETGNRRCMTYCKLEIEIMDKLEGYFPKRLTLEEQGAFILGYYQQRNQLPQEQKKEEN